MVGSGNGERGPSHRGELQAYAKAVGGIVGRLLRQITAAFVASAVVMLVCWLPRVSSPTGFRILTAVGTGAGVLRTLSFLECSQLVAECFFLVFVLSEFVKALVRIARLGWLRNEAPPGE